MVTIFYTSYRTRGLTTVCFYGTLPDLTTLDLRVEKRRIHRHHGPSGCGKTTLLNIMGLLDRADSGEYFLDGTSVAPLSAPASPGFAAADWYRLPEF